MRLHSNEDHSLEDADLRRGNSSPVTCCLSKCGQRVAQIADEITNFNSTGILYINRSLPKNRVAQL